MRKNIAAVHWSYVLIGEDPQAWGAEASPNDLGEFSPWWMYRGPAHIERVLAQYPLSRDISRNERLHTALTLYRLTLGQPRQEDMLGLLAQREEGRGGLVMIDFRVSRGS